MSQQLYYPRARALLQVIFDGFGSTAKDSAPVILPVLPKAMTIHRNSYNQPDSWELVLDADDLPVDPDLIRAGAAELYLFQVDDGASQGNVASRAAVDFDTTPVGLSGPSSQALELGTAQARERFALGAKPVVAGLFDDASIEMDSSGKWVTISGQDYTAHLIATQWPPTSTGRARRIPTGRRIDDIISEILAEVVDGGDLKLVVRGIEDSALPIVGASETRTNKRGIPVEQDTSYWDVIYKLATRHGLICFVDGLELVLAAPQNLNSASTPKRLAWGRNIESLQLSRHLGKVQVPTIVMLSYDDKGRKGATIDWPEGEYTKERLSLKGHQAHSRKETTRTSKKGKVTTTVKNRDEYQFHTIRGITSPAVLRQAAEALHHLIGRGERKVVVRTKDLLDLQDSDLLGLKSGDAVNIEWDDFNSAILRSDKLVPAAKVAHLTSRGYNRAIAELIVDRYQALAGLQRPLRVREATFEWAVDSGIAIELELVDFVMVDGKRQVQP